MAQQQECCYEYKRSLVNEQLFVPKIFQRMQAVLVLSQNNSIDEMTASSEWILEITRTLDFEVYSANKRLQTTQNDVAYLHYTLPRYLNIYHDHRCFQTHRRSSPQKGSVTGPWDNSDCCRHHNTYGKSSKNFRNHFSFSSSKLSCVENTPENVPTELR